MPRCAARAIALGAVLALGASAQDAPITIAGGELGDLLRKWHAEGTAAGNKGDFYDNRDREHSGLALGPYPQLAKITYSEEEKQKRLDWAYCPLVHPGVVFGNSSTSAGPWEGGSNPRRGYVDPRGLAILLGQYTRNNIYIYPEHRDHDPGHNGAPDGFGDLYPANTPFLIISQGSSGSDQPFMKAIPFTLAAFRPEVKKKLVETGLLMPVVQMVFRWCNKHLEDPAKDYLTSKAHPTVFEGAWVDPLKMAKMAHEITIETIPPVAMIKVIEEDSPQDGRDFFEPGATEKHFDSFFAVARIFRGKQRVRRIVVSAEGSSDVNKRPLTFHWAVLRGDPAAIRISKRNDAGSAVEILVPYPGRRPVSPGSPLESNRVDIGAFVHNGAYWSPPSFITSFSLDHEARTYAEDGRLLEIGYQTGETTFSIQDWTRLSTLLEADSWPARFLRERLTADELAALRKAAADHPALAAAAKAAEERKKQADAGRKKAEAGKAAEPEAFKKADQEAKDAQKALDGANRALKEGLDKPQETILRVLRAAAGDAMFYSARKADLEAFLQTEEGKGRRGALEGARSRIEKLGILPPRLLRPGNPTSFEQSMLERFHGEILSAVMVPGAVASSFKVNYVQPEISEPPCWRDVYRHDPKGNETGWTRYGDGEPRDFNAEGLLVLEKDAKGRPTKARTMKYEPEKIDTKAPRRRWPVWRRTLQIPGDEIRHYEYAGDGDWTGKVVRTEKVEPGAPK
jgi:hypothetical protein